MEDEAFNGRPSESHFLQATDSLGTHLTPRTFDSPQGLRRLPSILFAMSHTALYAAPNMSNTGPEEAASVTQTSRSATPHSFKEESDVEAQNHPGNYPQANAEKLAPATTNKTVDFVPNDPKNPFNWPNAKKYRACILACAMTFIVQINGTMMTSAAEQINESFHVSDEVFPHSYWPVLSWNLGGAAAPLVGLPLMENFGVRYTYLGIYAVLIIFIIPQAVAQNFATLIVVRIVTGSCTATLANITSGIVSDIWYAGLTKSFFTSMYIFALLSGLSMGPVFGSLVVQYTTWRWYVNISRSFYRN